MFLAAIAATVGLADAESRPRLLAFGSSDSCEWCRLLERRVFASDAWRSWASEHVAFEHVELPRGDGRLAPDDRKRNEELADKLNVNGIPTFVLLAPKEDAELGRIKVPDSSRGLGRDVTPEAFIAAVENALQSAPAPTPQQRLSPWRTYRFVPVIALLCVAVVLLTDKSKLPLALRGLKKALGSRVPDAPSEAKPIPTWKRVLAFFLILAAFLLAVL